MPPSGEAPALSVKSEFNYAPLIIILALAGCAAINFIINWSMPPLRSDYLEIHPSADSIVETAGFLSLGMRRMAADLGLIRLLVYYGTEEEGFANNVLENGGGFYTEVAPRARQILSLDPNFSFVGLYAAGALAFNLDRPQEAADLLQYALKRDPNNINYRALLGAIAFQHQQSAADAIRYLEPIALSPDCPTMLKSILAFLYIKQEMPDKAIGVYRNILATSRDAGYRKLAGQMIAKLTH